MTEPAEGATLETTAESERFDQVSIALHWLTESSSYRPVCQRMVARSSRSRHSPRFSIDDRAPNDGRCDVDCGFGATRLAVQSLPTYRRFPESMRNCNNGSQRPMNMVSTPCL